MQGKNRYKTTIAGDEYTIIGTATMGHMRLVAQTVDQQMNEIKTLTKQLDKTKIAVLTAINATSDVLRTKLELEELRAKMEELEKENELLKQEIQVNRES